MLTERVMVVAGQNSPAGISSVVTVADPISITLMIAAALVSSFLALRIRPAGLSGVSVSSPCTNGITTTPVSKPDRPSASAGNTSMAAATMNTGEPNVCCRPVHQLFSRSGWPTTSPMPLPITTALSPR